MASESEAHADLLTSCWKAFNKQHFLKEISDILEMPNHPIHTGC